MQKNINKSKTINSIEDIKFFQKSDEINSINLRLFSGQKYDKNKFEILSYITDNVRDIKEKGIEEIYLEVMYERIPKNIFKPICEFYNLVKYQLKCKISVNHSYEEERRGQFFEMIDWDIKTIIKANNSIDNVCDFIKSKKFTPAETLAYIHTYVTSIANYNSSKDDLHNWASRDQYFAGEFMELPEVVCLGYSSLMKEIIDNLNMPELQCEIVAVEYEDTSKGKIESHARCYIKLKDKEYGIDMSCFDDPTWDKCGNGEQKYANFLLPSNIHDKEMNHMLEYFEPNFLRYENNRADRLVDDINPCSCYYNNNKEKIDQLKVEKIFFNMFNKAETYDSFDELYTNMVLMAKRSFDYQVHKGFEGNLQDSELLLTENEAKEIYKKNMKFIKSQKGAANFVEIDR